MTNHRQSTLDQLLTPGVTLEWENESEQRTIQSLHCWGGTFEVDHQLPPTAETVALLRVAGLGAAAVSDCLQLSKDTVNRESGQAYDLVGTPKLDLDQPRLPVALGHFCLEGGLLRLTEPIPSRHTPSKQLLNALSLLGAGKSWERAALTMDCSPETFRRNIAKEYKEATVGGIHPTPLLLYAYGARHLNPSEVVGSRTSSRMQSLRSARKNVYHTFESADRALPLQPFQDEDKIIWLAKEPSGEKMVTKIEACGAVLEVDNPDRITNLDGIDVPVSPRDKHALVLLALGGSLEEINVNCMSPRELRKLMERLGTRKQDIRGPTQSVDYAKTVQLACTSLLTPIKGPEWKHTPNYMWVEQYLNCKDASRRTKILNRETRVGSLYRPQNVPTWSMLNVQLLLAHADGLPWKKPPKAEPAVIEPVVKEAVSLHAAKRAAIQARNAELDSLYELQNTTSAWSTRQVQFVLAYTAGLPWKRPPKTQRIVEEVVQSSPPLVEDNTTSILNDDGATFSGDVRAERRDDKKDAEYQPYTYLLPDRDQSKLLSVRPQPFRPFSDQDKVMWLAPARGRGVEVAYIEACGASFEVIDTHTLFNVHGEQITLSSKEKFALLLLTLGADITDLDAYCISPPKARALFKKMGFASSQTSWGKTFYAGVVYMACHAFLTPITPSDRQNLDIPDTDKLKRYLNGTMPKFNAFFFREEFADYIGAYTQEEWEAWNSLNLKLLLAHAENRLPPNLL